MAASKKSSKKKAKKAKIKKAPKSRSMNAEGSNVLMTTTLDTLYILDISANPVLLEIKAGAAGQTSDMTIELDNIIIAENHAGDLDETSLGTNSELNGKRLRIAATIADTSQDTDLTSLHIKLTGGAESMEFPLGKRVHQRGGSADYLCLIEFIRPL